MKSKIAMEVWVRVAFACLLQDVGWKGIAGLALMCGSACSIALLPRLPSASLAIPALPASANESLVVSNVESAAAFADVPIPSTSDVPGILRRMQRSARSHGLPWPRADYSMHPATENNLASIEIRCSMSGKYPELRAFITDLLLDAPTLTLREFSLSRPSSASSEVEAKLSFLIYMAEPTGAVTQPRAGGFDVRASN